MSKSKKTQKTSALKLSRSAIAESLEDRNAREAAKIEIKRKRLLARVAGHVAMGVLTNPSPSTNQADAVAEIAVSIAEEILKRVGL